MNIIDQMEARIECNAKISSIVDNNKGCRFKIGKTSQSLDKRFKNGYAETYDEMHQIYISTDTELIDWLEKELIKEYLLTYPSQCDNKQIGGGPDEEDIALVGMIYIVVKTA